MAFGDGILQCLGLKNELSRCPFRITVFGNDGAIIGGVKKIAEITESEIAFITDKKIVAISGKNLKITCYGENEAAISGVISCVSISDRRKDERR